MHDVLALSSTVSTGCAASRARSEWFAAPWNWISTKGMPAYLISPVKVDPDCPSRSRSAISSSFVRDHDHVVSREPDSLAFRDALPLFESH